MCSVVNILAKLLFIPQSGKYFLDGIFGSVTELLSKNWCTVFGPYFILNRVQYPNSGFPLEYPPLVVLVWNSAECPEGYVSPQAKSSP